MYDDRRTHPRFRLRRKVGIVQSDGEVVFAWSHDISMGGIQILTEYSADVGQQFDIYFGVTDPRTMQHAYVEVRTQVAHFVYDGPERSYRIGLQFLKFRGQSKELLVRFLQERHGAHD